MLYYNKGLNEFAGIMSAHHHHEGQAHPPSAAAPSILRLSALQRLTIAFGLIALIWAATYWALH